MLWVVFAASPRKLFRELQWGGAYRLAVGVPVEGVGRRCTVALDPEAVLGSRNDIGYKDGQTRPGGSESFD